ncbi:hypothetical protein IB233_01150 [Comamonas sp. CMM01]|uniref:hypothetical protein n=1 Tax=Comamonas TaxID=283 RepID=UPI00178129DF|nr:MULTISPECIES: hypothetical protein [Comamonas]MBD9530238.1 hypothetical protein [Comamonas sp. CMM01]MDH0048808.1 hypothetical protein [Comamonas terrigena]MDH0511733.1 hypothetical protein [Comamonas terrigena]MDH1091064.1 hypothetical protein [Comamonas terrigena]MDH1500991.1 hypothetical protein [Comamonas terrigena]
MPQYIAHKPRRASDENWVLSAVSISLVAVLCMFALGYFLSNHWRQEAQEQRQQQQQFDAYRRATAPPAAPAAARPTSPPLPADMQKAQEVRARLLANPNVTPGPGFDRPGVQSTGAAIVDAIDTAQERSAR